MNENVEEYFKNPTTFDNLERFISIYNPSETIIISNLTKNDITDIISFINLKSKTTHIVSLTDDTNANNVRARNCEKQTYQTNLLTRFYVVNDINAFMESFYDNVYATQSFCFLLDFIYQHNPYLIKNISEPILETSNDKMVLANHSLKQLNVIDDNNYRGKYSSVVKMLNECLTSMGQRKFEHNILNPVTNKEYLTTEYNITEHLLVDNFTTNYDTLKKMLLQIRDVSKIMRDIIIQKVSPKMLYQLFKSIQYTNNIYAFLNNNLKLKSYLNQINFNFNNINVVANKLTTYLDNVLIMDLCQDVDNISKVEESFIKNGVDTELDDKIRLLMDSQDQLNACRDYFSSLVENYESTKKTVKKTTKKTTKKTATYDENDYDEKGDDNDVDADAEKYYVRINETEKNNFKLLATERRSAILKDLLKNMTEITLKYKSTYSGMETTFKLNLDLEYVKHTKTSVHISSKQIDIFCKNVSSIKIGLIDIIKKVYQTNIIMKLQLLQDDIELIGDYITAVDVIYAKAFVADKYKYCKPMIDNSDKSFIKATDLRHCIIENIQQNELYVSNNIQIGVNNGYDGILLYGTNAVGKTSFIKAIGISIIMAQAGLYVPASSFIFSPYKYIFTRILGNDNLFKGLSTFAVEMSELRTILRLADKNSLVLGDELCSGTESISATSIFVAGISMLASVGSSFIFATHLHEIINYDEIKELTNVSLKHMSVIFDKERNCLVYNRKLQDGPGTSMYGLEVCKSLNLPSVFLEKAMNIRTKYNPESSSILEQKQSHFNSKHIQGGLCEKCNKNPAVDVHHLIYQNEANDKGTIKKDGLLFDKNNKANLLNLCENCHNLTHKEKKSYKKTKTTIGIVLEEISP
jgi:DNA mismatch repair protein MutS